MARSNFPVEVTRVRQLTPRVREYLLTSVDGRPLPEYGPGAHVAVHTVSPERGLIVRHYSLVGGGGIGESGQRGEDGDDPRHTYRIAVQKDSERRGSAHIHRSFEPGLRIEIGPPTNNFPLERTSAPVLLLAGGIGITPIFSMARSLARRHRPFRVVYAGRNRHEMAYHDELARLAGNATTNAATFHYSDTAGQLDLAALLGAQAAGTLVYVCGPAGMVDATHAAGSALGWDAARIRSERFGAQRPAAARAFDVHLRRSGRTVHVSEDASILDALNAAGVPVLWDCRRGECGLCPLAVVERDGPLEHHDRYLTDEDKAAGDTLCICVSRTCGTALTLDA
ncbi:PDR/VanB family oxidoreductase [Paraburkholderia acidisoli]|uniref:2Fe-2S iron-sulfur cluster binding domain-containing protein n=1 Tax=Paraburkholderia acidisoli TaxID=2571748 RepID=A0A7Z2GS28_9BURK|nr:PDR/VanB family oxidoreductase [Paraburkholderia acidisoli]QGZ66761.1 2Fe-2S iron-sulfur cluster binding domain-containing protein [Paraburkholderia acidisoli]